MKCCKRAIAYCLIIIMFVTMFIPISNTVASATSPADMEIYTSASEWAKPEIEKAYNYWIIPQRILLTDASKPATREELCELAVLLYEKVTGKKAEPASPNPFTDTANTEILKAYKLGITSGTSATAFSPSDITNREQVATMFGRTIRNMFPNADYSSEGAPVFLDQPDISSWALEHVMFMSKAGIILGTAGKFMPKAVTDAQKTLGYGTTKREEAIAIAVRIYIKYKKDSVVSDVGESNAVVSNKEKAAISLIQSAKPSLSEQEKFSKIDFNNRLFRPVYKPKITLMAADGYESDGIPTYSSAPYSATIRSDGNKIQSFKLSLPDDVLSQTSQIIWQVSLVPFNGKAVTGSTPVPGGLLLNGNLSKQTKEFTIDFSKVVQADNALRKPKQISLQARINSNILNINPVINPISSWNFSKLLSGTSAPESTALCTYYVRAYPVDSSGKSIGDAGSGLPVIYGDPLVSRTKLLKVSIPFSLKPAKMPGTVSYKGEFPNNFSNLTEVSMDNTGPKIYSVLPAGYPTSTRELKLQVSLANYASSSNDSWKNTPGVAYEKSIFPNDTVFSDLKSTAPMGLEIDFSQFVPPDEQLPETEKIPYYIRVISFTEGSQPGTINAQYSKTITINYGKSQAEDFYFLEEIKINPNLPQITKVSYTPIQWETEGWQYHYTVIRQPSMKELFGGVFSNDPYTPYAVGTKLDLTPQPDKEKSWWEEAWNAITDFFNDLVDFLADVVNWVSKAYADLKSGLINFVVSALPLPDYLKGPLQIALTAMVDYGLASIGIPPTLPNFDELSEMGVDYLATVAMEQAGVPAGDLMTDGVVELAGGIRDNLKSSANSASPNPMNWNFIKQDPDYLYKPAYIMVELYNPSTTETTPAGKLSCTVDKLMDLLKNGTDPSITRLYAAYGSSWVALYKPVFGMTIPAMAPGQHLSVPIFLEEYVGVPFYSGGPSVIPSDFNIMYGGLGSFDFNIFIQYDLPSVMEEANKQGYTKDAIYSYSTFGNSRSFSVLPTASYSN